MAHGRLADPESTLGTDPRSDPRMVKVLAQFGLDGHPPVSPVTVDSPLEDRLARAAEEEQAMSALFETLAHGFPAVGCYHHD